MLKVSVVTYYIDVLCPGGELDWLKSRLLENLNRSGVNGISTAELCVGERSADLGWVVGYRTVNGGMVDVDFTAEWSCRSIRDVKISDLLRVWSQGDCKTYSPVRL